MGVCVCVCVGGVGGVGVCGGVGVYLVVMVNGHGVRCAFYLWMRSTQGIKCHCSKEQLSELVERSFASREINYVSLTVLGRTSEDNSQVSSICVMSDIVILSFTTDLTVVCVQG